MGENQLLAQINEGLTILHSGRYEENNRRVIRCQSNSLITLYLPGQMRRQSDK